HLCVCMRATRCAGCPGRLDPAWPRASGADTFSAAKVADRGYLRFVPLGGDEPIVREMGICLRMIQCQEVTERVVPADLQAAAFDAWESARRGIFDSWKHETDRANLHRGSQSSAAPSRPICASIPRRCQPEALEGCLEAIEALCPRREENQLRAESECH